MSNNTYKLKDRIISFITAVVMVITIIQQIPVTVFAQEPAEDGYAITIAEDVTSGTVTADMEQATAGTIVTLTVTPDEGKQLADLTVSYTNVVGNSETIAHTKGEDGKYTFEMPDAGVTVSADFKNIPATVTGMSIIVDGTEYSRNDGVYITPNTRTVTVKLFGTYLDHIELNESVVLGDHRYSIADDGWEFSDDRTMAALTINPSTLTDVTGAMLYFHGLNNNMYDAGICIGYLSDPGTDLEKIYFNNNIDAPTVKALFFNCDDAAFGGFVVMPPVEGKEGFFYIDVPEYADVVEFWYDNDWIKVDIPMASERADMYTPGTDGAAGKWTHYHTGTLAAPVPTEDGKQHAKIWDCCGEGEAEVHSFDSTTGKCVCGIEAQAKIGETYYLTLAQAAQAVTAGNNVIEVRTDVTIGKDETVSFAEYAVLNVAGGKNINCNGTVKIGVEDGVIYENKLYFYGGDITATGLEIKEQDCNTYYKAGDGCVILHSDKADKTIELTLHNATIQTENEGLSVYDTNCNTFNVNYAGSNNICGSLGIYTVEYVDEMTLKGAQGSTLNVTGTFLHGIHFSEGNGECIAMTLDGGTVTAEGAVYGVFSQGAVNVINGAALNAAGNVVGLYYCSTVSGNVNATTMTSTIDGEGNVDSIAFSVAGNGTIEADCNLPAIPDNIEFTFTVPDSTILTVNQGVTLDLSGLAIADISIVGTVINNGTIRFPADFNIENAPKDGTVYIGEKFYTWDDAKDKWICSNIDHIWSGDRCTICGITGYGVYIKGIRINEANSADVLGDGTVSYNAETSTLTLSGANIINSDAVHTLQINNGDVKLVLVGENMLGSGDESHFAVWIENGASLTVSESSAGSLTAPTRLRAYDIYGYLSQEKIYVNRSITGDGNFTVKGGTIRGSIFMGGDITIIGGTVDADYLAAENVTITGGTITAHGRSNINYEDSNAPSGTYGIYADNNILINGGAVTANGGYANITETLQTNVIAKATATAAMFASNTIDITGGTVTATGGGWNGYAPDSFGSMVQGNFSEDPTDFVKSDNVIDLYGRALKAQSYAISDNATFICGSDTTHDMQYCTDDENNTIAYKCVFCGTADETVTVTVNAEDIIYNGSPYNKASVVYGDGWNSSKDLVIIYTGTTFGGEAYNSTAAPSKAGSYTATIEIGNAKAEAVFKIVQKELIPSFKFFAPNPKLYNGTTELPIIRAEFDNVVTGDDIGPGYDAPAHFEDANVGENKTVYITGVYITGDDAANYTVKDTYTTTWSISPAQITVTPKASQTKVYGTADREFDYEITAGQLYGEDELTGALGREAGETVGEYAYTIGTLANPNYNITLDGTNKFAITQAPTVVIETPTASELTYNGEAQALVTAGMTNGGTLVYSLSENGQYSDTIPTATNADTYTVWYYVQGNENYIDSEKTSVKVSINRKSLLDEDVTLELIPSVVDYNGKLQKPQVVIKHDGKLLDEDVDYNITYPSNETMINSGSFSIGVLGQGNYSDFTSASYVISSLTPAASDFAFTPPSDLVYDGTVKEATFIPNLTDGKTGIGAVSDVKYYKDGKQVGSATNAGTYTVTINVDIGDNYNSVSDLTDASWTFTISPKDITADDVELNGTLGYNGKEQTQQITVAEGIEYTVTGNKATDIGTYELTVTASGNYTGSVTKQWNIIKGTPDVSNVTATIAPNETAVNMPTFTGASVEGVYTITSHDVLVWGENTVEFSFMPADSHNYTTATGTTTITVTDTIAPTGTVSVETNSWKEFINSITFDLFFNKTVDVTADAEDALSGVAAIDYIESNEALTREALKRKDNWTSMGADGKVSVTVEDAKQFIYYIRITDNAGNVAYISTDGVTFDTTAPAISGITDGATYYTTQKFTVTDENLADVKVNSATVKDYTLAGNVTATYTVSVTDDAGNSATVTVTMKPISVLTETLKDLIAENVTAENSAALAAAESALAAVDTTNATQAEKDEIAAAQTNIDSLQRIIEETAEEVKALEELLADYDKETVKSSDEAAIDRLIADLTDKLEDVNLTAEQKTALKIAKTEAENLLKEITDNQKALEDALTAEKDTTADNYQLSDKGDLKEVVADLESITDEINKNYTSEEKQTAQNEIERINSIIGDIEEIEDTTAKADNAADKQNNVEVVPDNKEAVEEAVEAKQAYDRLNERQKELLGQEKAEQIEEMYNKAIAFKIIKGVDGKWTKSSSKGLEFTANGNFDLFTSVKVDYVTIGTENYTAVEGSTVVTLNAEYLNSLEIGKHTLTVTYNVLGGEYTAGCEFTVKAILVSDTETIPPTNNDVSEIETTPPTGNDVPETGDNTNTLGWMVVMLSSMAALAVVLKKNMKTDKC